MKNKIQYEDRVVCFLDILGFSEHIRESVMKDGNDHTKKIESIANALEVIREILDIDRPEELHEKTITQFSDSIVISFPVSAESGVFYSLLEILWIQMSLLRAKMLCRGGVARGKLIHTDKLLFGPAMIDAYTLESKAALYPRVILDDSIINAGMVAHAEHHHPEYEKDEIMKMLKKDSDGMFYIDYITSAQSELDDPELDHPEYLAMLQRIIATGVNNPNPSIQIKYKWIREKFSPYLKRIKTDMANKPPYDELRQAYESVPDI